MSTTFRYVAVFVFAVLLISTCSDLGEGLPQIPCDPSNVIPCDGPQGSWELLGLGEERVTAIAVDQCDPRTVYAGSMMDFSAGVVGKLFKSTDCGKTWQLLLTGGSYGQIVIDPRNSSIVYTAPHALMRSIDAGRTWTELKNGMKIDSETRIGPIAMDPQSSAVLYAGTGGFFGGTLYKSTDFGDHWAKILPDSIGGGITSLAVDDQNANIMYAGIMQSGRMLKTNDGGTTWVCTNLPQMGGLVHDILISPLAPNEVLAGVSFAGVWKSSDAGQAWASDNTGIPNSSNVTKIAFSIFDDAFYVVVSRNDEGGVYVRRRNDASWRKIGIEGLNQSYYYNDLLVDAKGRALYFGLKGVYRMKF